MWKCSDSDRLCKVTANNIFCDETRLDQMIFMLSPTVFCFFYPFPLTTQSSKSSALNDKILCPFKRYKKKRFLIRLSKITVEKYICSTTAQHRGLYFTAGVDYFCLKVKRTFIVSMPTCTLQTDAGRHPGIFSALPLTHYALWHTKYFFQTYVTATTKHTSCLYLVTSDI